MTVSKEDLARWYRRPSAVLRRIPAWSGIRVLQRPLECQDGAVWEELELPRWPLGRRRWRSRVEDLSDEGFTDVQDVGPFASWRREHRFLAQNAQIGRLEDHVAFERAGPWPIRSLAERMTERALTRRIPWEHQRVRNELRRHQEAGDTIRTVLVTGSSGMVGRALCAFLASGGHEVRRLVRRGPDASAGEFAWDPAKGEIDLAALEGVDAVVNLAGAGIADKRWTPGRMELIRTSRVDSTALVADAIVKSKAACVLVNASATGYYVDRPEGELDETAQPGTSFLGRTCVAWESAAEAAREAGVRVASIRIGVVVAAAGGAVAQLRRPVLMGIGGPVGNGRQGMPWVALDDLLAMILHAIVDERYEGPINAVAPKCPDNRGFMRAMGRVLRRPTVAPLPAFVARALFGKMGEEALLMGAFVVPRRLQELGFRHDFPELEAALRFELGRQG